MAPNSMKLSLGVSRSLGLGKTYRRASGGGGWGGGGGVELHIINTSLPWTRKYWPEPFSRNF